MSALVENLETVSNKSAECWVISRIIIGPVGDGSVRITDGTSLVGMMVEWLNNFAVNL